MHKGALKVPDWVKMSLGQKTGKRKEVGSQRVRGFEVDLGGCVLETRSILEKEADSLL